MSMWPRGPLTDLLLQVLSSTADLIDFSAQFMATASALILGGVL